MPCWSIWNKSGSVDITTDIKGSSPSVVVVQKFEEPDFAPQNGNPNGSTPTDEIKVERREGVQAQPIKLDDTSGSNNIVKHPKSEE